MSWRAALDDFDAYLGVLESTLDDGRWPRQAERGWQPPDAPRRLPTADELDRYRALLTRAERCQARLRAGLADTTAGLERARRTRAADLRYRQDGRSSPPARER